MRRVRNAFFYLLAAWIVAGGVAGWFGLGGDDGRVRAGAPCGPAHHWVYAFGGLDPELSCEAD